MSSLALVLALSVSTSTLTPGEANVYRDLIGALAEVEHVAEELRLEKKRHKRTREKLDEARLFVVEVPPPVEVMPAWVPWVVALTAVAGLGVGVYVGLSAPQP